MKLPEHEVSGPERDYVGYRGCQINSLMIA